MMAEKQKEYLRLLTKIDGELIERDIKHLLFLCGSTFPLRIQQEIKRGLDLFEKFEKQNLISEDNVTLLHIIFGIIGRIDLQGMLPRGSVFENDSNISVSHSFPDVISPFNCLLFQLHEDLNDEEVENLRYASGTSRSLQIKSALDLFKDMKKKDKLGPQNVSHLCDILNCINRFDLSEKVTRFVLNSSCVPSRSNEPMQTSSSQNSQEAIMPILTEELSTTSSNTTPIKKPFSQLNIPCEPSGFQSPPEPENLSVSDRSAQPVLEFPNHSKLNYRYKMTSQPRGICLVINNETFTPTTPTHPLELLKERRGSSIDTENLKTCFEDLQFITITKNNVTHHEMRCYLKEISCLDHSIYDCFVCCILSHGGEGFIYCSDYHTIKVQEILSFFSPRECPTLGSKPKLFFLSCCQGQTQPRAMSCPVAASQSSILERDGPEEMVSEAADYLIGYATPPGYASFRDTNRGTLYVQELTAILKENHKKEHLVDMLTMVNQRLSERPLKVNGVIYKQVGAPLIMLTKQVWF